MKDPASIGIAASVGTVMLLAVWKAKGLRWAVIVLLLIVGFFSLSTWADPRRGDGRGRDGSPDRSAFVDGSLRAAERSKRTHADAVLCLKTERLGSLEELFVGQLAEVRHAVILSVERETLPAGAEFAIVDFYTDERTIR